MNELRHYGVKGMKWGVRRGHTTSGPYDEQRKASERLHKKPTFPKGKPTKVGNALRKAKDVNDILTTTKSVSKKSTTKPVTKKSVDKGKKIVSKSQDKKVDEITASDYPIALQMAKRWREQQAMQFYIEWAQNIANS